MTLKNESSNLFTTTMINSLSSLKTSSIYLFRICITQNKEVCKTNFIVSLSTTFTFFIRRDSSVTFVAIMNLFGMDYDGVREMRTFK